MVQMLALLETNAQSVPDDKSADAFLRMLKVGCSAVGYSSHNLSVHSEVARDPVVEILPIPEQTNFMG